MKIIKRRVTEVKEVYHIDEYCCLNMKLALENHILYHTKNEIEFRFNTMISPDHIGLLRTVNYCCWCGQLIEHE